jgi:hypothetical protein
MPSMQGPAVMPRGSVIAVADGAATDAGVGAAAIGAAVQSSEQASAKARRKRQRSMESFPRSRMRVVARDVGDNGL